MLLLSVIHPENTVEIGVVCKKSFCDVGVILLRYNVEFPDVFCQCKALPQVVNGCFAYGVKLAII